MDKICFKKNKKLRRFVQTPCLSASWIRPWFNFIEPEDGD